MSLGESACYTLINVPDMEPFNEMQIKQELGKCEEKFRQEKKMMNWSFMKFLTFFHSRKR